MGRMAFAALSLVLVTNLGCTEAKGPVEGKTARPQPSPLPRLADQQVTGVGEFVGVGDVNGDGQDDLLGIGFGEAWVIFEQSNRWNIGVDEIGARGFKIEAISKHPISDATGADVNGDGFSDIILGDREADILGRGAPGAAFVVFGKASTEPVSLEDLLSEGSEVGYVIQGANDFDWAGEHLARVGDLNQDDLEDVAIGAPSAGLTYVVFGQRQAAPVDLRNLGTGSSDAQGYTIRTVRSGQHFSLSSAGDLNGDGMFDLAIGTNSGGGARGRFSVVFGKSSVTPVNTLRAGGWGYVLRTTPVHSGVGDVNGDSFDDLALRTYTKKQGPRVFVAFGSSDETGFQLGNPNDGFWITGADRGNISFGSSISSGDINGDGLSDLLIGDPGAEEAAKGAGAVYVVYGSKESTPVSVGQLGNRGRRIDVPQKGLYLGAQVYGLADIDGNGRDEIAAASYMGTGRDTVGLVFFN